jgi:hypothetical protein
MTKSNLRGDARLMTAIAEFRKATRNEIAAHKALKKARRPYDRLMNRVRARGMLLNDQEWDKVNAMFKRPEYRKLSDHWNGAIVARGKALDRIMRFRAYSPAGIVAKLKIIEEIAGKMLESSIYSDPDPDMLVFQSPDRPWLASIIKDVNRMTKVAA